MMYDRHFEKLRRPCVNYLSREDRNESLRRILTAERNLESEKSSNHYKSKRIAELSKENNNFKNELECLKKEKEEMTRLLNIRDREIQFLNEKLIYYKKLATPNIELKNMLDNVMPENNKFKKDLFELNFKYSELQPKYETLLTELSEIKELYETEKNKKCQNCNDFGLPITAHTTAVDILNESVPKHAEGQKQNAVLKGNCSNLQIDINHLRKEYLRLKELYENNKKTLDEYANSHFANLEKIRMLENEQAFLKNELEKSQNLCLNYLITLGEYREKYLEQTEPDAKKRRIE